MTATAALCKSDPFVKLAVCKRSASRRALSGNGCKCRTEPAMGAAFSGGVVDSAHNNDAEPSGWHHAQKLCGAIPKRF